MKEASQQESTEVRPWPAVEPNLINNMIRLRRKRHRYERYLFNYDDDPEIGPVTQFFAMFFIMGSAALLTMVITIFLGIAIYPVIAPSVPVASENFFARPQSAVEKAGRMLSLNTKQQEDERELFESALVLHFVASITSDIGSKLDARTLGMMAQAHTLRELDALRATIARQVPEYTDINLLTEAKTTAILDSLLVGQAQRGHGTIESVLPKQGSVPPNSIHHRGTLTLHEQVTVLIPQGEIFSFEYEADSTQAVTIHAHNFGKGAEQSDPYIVLYDEHNQLLQINDDSDFDEKYDAQLSFHAKKGQRIVFDVGNLREGVGKVAVHISSK